MATMIEINKKYAQNYVRSMLKKGLVKGELPFKVVENGVVLEERYGGGFYTTQEEAYEAIYAYLFYPKVFMECYAQGV